MKKIRYDGMGVIERIKAEGLYLKTGSMLFWLDRAIKRDISQVKAIFIEGGVIALSKVPIEAESRWNASLFVKEDCREQGKGKQLVNAILAEFPDYRLIFHPWDKRSVSFFSKLVEEGILTLDNFTSYDRKCLEEIILN